MLDNLPAEPTSDKKNPISVNPRFRESLSKAIDLYSEARAEALDTLYKNLKVITGTRDRREEWAADVEEVAGCCGYFSYCLQEFAQEMLVFLNILEQMEAYQEWPTRSWSWLKFWKKEKELSSGSSGGMILCSALNWACCWQWSDSLFCSTGHIETSRTIKDNSEYCQRSTCSIYVQNLEAFADFQTWWHQVWDQSRRWRCNLCKLGMNSLIKSTAAYIF